MTIKQFIKQVLTCVGKTNLPEPIYLKEDSSIAGKKITLHKLKFNDNMILSSLKLEFLLDEVKAMAKREGQLKETLSNLKKGNFRNL